MREIRRNIIIAYVKSLNYETADDIFYYNIIPEKGVYCIYSNKCSCKISKPELCSYFEIKELLKLSDDKDEIIEDDINILSDGDDFVMFIF